MSKTYKAFYARKKGHFTIQDQDGNAVFKQLIARSGASRYQDTSWTRGKSPIPYSHQVVGKLWLYTKPAGPEYGPPAKAGGIGRFYPIGSGDSQTKITGKEANARWHEGLQRWFIGLHMDNNWTAKMVNKVWKWLHVGDGWKGSAGCVVLSVDTPKQRQQGQAVFTFLDGLHAQGIERIELVVV